MAATVIKTPEQIFKEKKISGYINPDFMWSEYIGPEEGIPSLELLHNAKLTMDEASLYKHKVFGGAKAHVTSGGRSMAHHLRVYAELNAERKAKKLPLLKVPMGSLHLKFLAVDITYEGYSNKQVYKKLDAVHFGGVEFPDDQNRIHFDLRGKICRFIGATGRVVAHHYNEALHNKIFHG